MRKVRPVVVALVTLCALVGCSLDGGDAGDAKRTPDAVPTSVSPTVATTEALTSADEPGAVVAPDWDGPATLITASLGNLVALDLTTGRTAELARGTALAESLGLRFGRFNGADLSPDGSTVAFAFGGTDEDGNSSYGLYEVPVDGSADAVRVAPDAVGSFASNPVHSPDGRRLAAYLDGRLVVLNGDRSIIGGVDLAYPPNHLTWSPAGDRLMWLPDQGRGPCCVHAIVAFDTATGDLSSEPTKVPSTGSPAFDGSGQLQSVMDGFQFDVDASGRFVVGSDDTPGELLWWILGEDAPPRPLPLDIDLQEAPTVAAW